MLDSCKFCQTVSKKSGDSSPSITPFFLKHNTQKKNNRRKFSVILVSFSINTNLIFFDIRYYVVSKLSIFIFRLFNSVILTELWVFCCLLKIIICSLRSLFLSARSLPDLKQVIATLPQFCCFLWSHEHHSFTIYHIALRLFVWKIYSKRNQKHEYIL